MKRLIQDLRKSIVESLSVGARDALPLPYTGFVRKSYYRQISEIVRMYPKQKTHRSATQPCDWSIEQLPGLSEEDCLKLQALGITTTGQLLQKANTLQSKQALANQLQVKSQYVNKWIALADLARIPSIGCQYCGLLLHSGIMSVTQLAQTPAHKLHQQILRLQVATLQRRDLCPPVEEVAVWVKQARALIVR